MEASEASEDEDATEAEGVATAGRLEGVGRALSHDQEPLPWEARSTKVSCLR